MAGVRVVSGDEPRKNLQSALSNDEVVVPAMEFAAAHLVDAKSPPFGAIGHGELLEANDAVRQAMETEVVDRLRKVVQEQDGAAMLGEEVLERENLAAETKRALCQQAYFRKAVEHHACRGDTLDLVLHQLDRLAELQVRRIDDRLFALLVEAELGRDEFEDLDPVERPAVRLRHVQQLFLALGQSDVETALILVAALEQELQPQRRLAGARLTFEQVDSLGGEPSSEDVIERWQTRRHGPAVVQKFRLGDSHRLPSLRSFDAAP